jgi:phage terminase Nu1 subunit (DNA packaging protein)
MLPDRISAAAAADLLGVSAPTFGKLIAEHAFERQPPKHGYDPREVTRGTVAHYMRRAAGRAGQDGGMLLAKERALLASEQRITAHLRNATTRGELVRLELVARKLEDMFSVLREIAMGVAGKVSDAVAAHTAQDRVAVYAIIDGEIREMLTVMSTPEIVGPGPQKLPRAGRRKIMDDAKELAHE